MTKKVNIIGAGLAGLSTGIYLQQNGYETEIFEMAPWAGGMCTAWLRSGYRFDGCIHWMVGTKKNSQIYKLYREVEALGENTVIYNADIIQIEIHGVLYDIPMELENFKKFLISLPGQDGRKVHEFCKEIEAVANSDMMLGAPSGPVEVLKMLTGSWGFLKIAKKYMGMTVGEFAERFQDGVLKDLILKLMPGEFSAIALIMMLGTRLGGNAGYPYGGALDVIKRMEEKYRSLGGKINFSSRVDQIEVENGEAKGVYSKGQFYPSEAVVAACDAFDTLNHMLKNRFEHPQISPLLKNAPLFPPLAIVSFGLNKKFGIPYSLTLECPNGIETAPGVKQYEISVRSFDFDPAAAPAGCSSIMVMFEAPLAYWQNLREENHEEYTRQKQYLADAVTGELEKRYPGIKEAIAITDVATPATYVRLNNEYQGSFEGFAPIPSSMKVNIGKTIPGLKKFCICGQWTTAGGGICTAVNDGKTAANLVKKEIH